MEEVPTEVEDPLPSATAEGSPEVAEVSRHRMPLSETRKLGGIATRQVERVQEIMNGRRERLVHQAMVTELGRSARRGAMGRTQTS